MFNMLCLINHKGFINPNPNTDSMNMFFAYLGTEDHADIYVERAPRLAGSNIRRDHCRTSGLTPSTTCMAVPIDKLY